MTRISNAEQVLLLLRAHLQRRQRARAKKSGERPRAGALDRLKEVASDEPIADADLSLAMLSGILEEEFGPAIAADPKFQTMVGDIARILAGDPDAAKLVREAAATLLPGGEDTKG